MGLDRASIEFQTFYFSHVLVNPPSQAPPLPAQALVHPEKQVAQRGLAHPGGSQQQDVQAGAQAAVDI